jgi:hypothetical protein
MSVIKPELTLSCLKESRRYQFGECPIGTFVVRLYWADYSKYVPSSKKLDGVHLLKDSKTIYHRVCEFAITSIESLEYLIANCAPASGFKGNWFQKQTTYALMKFRGFAKSGFQFIKPIKVAVQAAATVVKSVVSKVVESASNTAKSIFRRFDSRQPQTFAKCTTLEQAKYLFDRCPLKDKTQALIDNYLAACDRISPQVKSYAVLPNPWDMLPLAVRPQLCLPAAKEALAVPQYGLSIDDITPTYYVPGEVQLQSLVVEADVIEVTENDYRQILTPVLNGKKAWTNLKNIGFQTGTVISGCPRAAKDLFEKVVKNCLKNQVAVSQLRDIIAAG